MYFFQRFPKALPKLSFLTFSLVTLMFSVQQERCFKGILKKELMRPNKNIKHWYHMPWSNLKKTIHHYFNFLFPVISEARVASFSFAPYIWFPLKSTPRQVMVSSRMWIRSYIHLFRLNSHSHFLLGKLQLVTLLGGSEEMYVFVCIENTAQNTIPWTFKWL